MSKQNTNRSEVTDKHCELTTTNSNQTKLQPDGYDCYAERKQSLVSLGYRDPKKYFKSPLWQGIKRTKLSFHPSCVVCGFKSAAVHLLDYRVETLQGNRMESLVPLCKVCWPQFAYGSDERPLRISQGNVLLINTLLSNPATHHAAVEIESVLRQNKSHRDRLKQQGATRRHKKPNQSMTRSQKRAKKKQENANAVDARLKLKEKQSEIQAMLQLTPAQRAIVQALPKLPYLN